MKRHELSDEQWVLLSAFFPPRQPQRGGQWRDDRTVLNGIFWRLNAGAPWRDVPERYGPRPTVYRRFAALRRSGVLDRTVAAFQLRLNEAGLIDPDLFGIDGTHIRAARAAGGAAGKKIPRPASRRTTPWGTAAAGSGPRCIWSPTGMGCRWPLNSRPDRRTRVRRSSRS